MFKSKILANSGIYMIINLLQKGINFLLIPILTTYLTTYDYGIVAVVTAVNAFLNVLYILSLNGCLNRFYYEYKEDKKKVKKLFGTIVTFVLGFSATLSIILVVGHKIFLDPFLKEVDFYPFMVLGMISVLFNPIFTIYQNTLQAKQEGKRYGRNNIAFFFTNLLFLLISVIILNLGAKGVLGALALTNLLFFIYSLFQFGKEFSFGIDKNILKQSLKYSLPLVPHSISGVTTNIIDRLFVNSMISTSITGIYNLGSTFGSIIFLIASGINQAFVPWFTERVKSNDIEKIPFFAKSLILVYCFVALGISFFSKEVIEWVTPIEYHEAWKIVPVISFAFVFHGCYYFFSTPFFYDISGKGSRTLPMFTITSAFLNVLLNYFLIKNYGMVGAASATLISKVFLVLGLSFYYKKFVNINYNVFLMIFLPMVFFGVSCVVYILPSDFEYLFGIKTIIYLLSIFITGYFAKPLINFLLNIITGDRKP
tara:strand:- start:7022 stop:8467 length:1446 start_codon:yes stop_codon:yes gene_type:complete